MTDAYDPRSLPGRTDHTLYHIHAECPVCGKVAFPTWSAARHAARSVRADTKDSTVKPYWSRQCQTYHVGGSHQLRVDGKRGRRRRDP